MFPTRVRHRSRRLLSIFSIVLAFTSTTPTMAASSLPADDHPQIAQVLAVIVDNKIVLDAEPPLVIITRAPGGCADTRVTRKGLPLCKGDRVKTASNVQLKIRFGEPEEKNEVVLWAGSEITISSIDCGRLCRWYSSLKSRIINSTQYVDLSNSGTVYDVDVSQDSSLVLNVYSGSVEVTKKLAPSTGSPPGPVDQVKVPRLFRLTVSDNGTVGSLEPITEVDLTRSLVFSSDAEIATHVKPAEVGGNVAKIPNFADDARRKLAFQKARVDQYLRPNEPQAFETLGKVYNDWGDAEQAKGFLSKALTLNPVAPNDDRRDDLIVNMAFADRQLGNHDPAALDSAALEIELIINKPNSVFFSDALNVRGCIYYAKARSVLRNDNSAEVNVQAQQLLALADADYKKALDSYREVPGRTVDGRQYIRVNSAQVQKARGDIAYRDKHYDPEAIDFYKTAINQLEEAYGRNRNNSPNSQNKIASLLVARARVALANTYDALHNSEEAAKYYDLANKTFQTAIDDAKKESQTFDEAYCGLASLQQILIQPGFEENYAKCVAFNNAALVEEADVPSVIQLTRALAIQALVDAGLQPVIEVEGQIVDSQDPDPQELTKKVRIGSKVKLRLKAEPRG